MYTQNVEISIISISSKLAELLQSVAYQLASAEVFPRRISNLQGFPQPPAGRTNRAAGMWKVELKHRLHLFKLCRKQNWDHVAAQI